LQLTEDIGILKPTFFPSVPRLFNKIYQKIQESLKAAPGCKYWFVDKCVNAKLDSLEQTGTTAHFLYDRMIFNKIKAILGGKVRLMLTGSAPISP
jgi:long-chain acyl-CoA synthetase